jgi:hypothetical protein
MPIPVAPGRENTGKYQAVSCTPETGRFRGARH